jgi:hypothetical protein
VIVRYKNSLGQRIYRQINSRSVGQENLRFLRIANVHNLLHMIPSVKPPELVGSASSCYILLLAFTASTKFNLNLYHGFGVNIQRAERHAIYSVLSLHTFHTQKPIKVIFEEIARSDVLTSFFRDLISSSLGYSFRCF